MRPLSLYRSKSDDIRSEAPRISHRSDKREKPGFRPANAVAAGTMSTLRILEGAAKKLSYRNDGTR
jgi:hypothetical protein